VARPGVEDEPQHRAAQRGGFELEFVIGHGKRFLPRNPPNSRNGNRGVLRS
jgi:hypothetical protein